MGRAMLRKSLIQFSVDAWSCVPSLLFTWGQTLVEVMKTMATTLKRPHACTATLSAPNPAAATTSPRLHQKFLNIHWQVWVSLFCGHCSFLLGPVHKVLLCPPRVYFTDLCKFWQLYVGLMVTSSKRAYAIPKAAAPRASVPSADHCRPTPPQEMLTHSSVSVSVGSLGPGAHKVCWSSLSISGRNGVSF